MPGGIEITTNKMAKRYYFPVPQVSLPILKKEGSLLMLPWGRRNEEEGLLPPGGWARLSSIKQGTWERYHAVPVKIPATGWMEKDENGTSHYFPLEDDECLQGLVASKGIEKRVYIVTIAASDTADIHPRAPRIIKTAKPTALHRVDNTLVKAQDDSVVAPSVTQSILPSPDADTKVSVKPTVTVPTLPELPSWSASLPQRQRILLQWIATAGDVSGSAIQTERFLRHLRQEDTDASG